MSETRREGSASGKKRKSRKKTTRKLQSPRIRRRLSADREARLLESAGQALAIARGLLEPGRVTERTARHTEVLSPPSFGPQRIRRLRKHLQASQQVFAELLNVQPTTVRAWERGARKPSGASVRLLEIAEERPEAILVKVRA